MLLALSSVIFVVIQDGISQKLGESCIIKQTNIRGVCTESMKCQSAIEDYRIRGLIPTFCDQCDDTPVVCCSSPVINTQEDNDATPVLNTAISSAQNLHISISEKNESCTVHYTNSPGKCTESSKCQSAKQDYEISGILPTFCNQSDTLVLVCCRDGITILGTEQNSDDKPELSEVVFSNQSTGAPLSEKEGDKCTVAQTNSHGVCTPASKCRTAIQEYQHNGIVPTYCKHSDDVPLVCCRDGITILDTEEVNELNVFNNTPLLKSSFHIEDAKNELNLKLGDSCVDKHTNSLGICTEITKCTSIQQEYQINGSVTTYCLPSGNVQTVCCRDDVMNDHTEEDEEYDDFSQFRSLLPLSQKLNKPLDQEVGDSCLIQRLIRTRGLCTEVSECQSAVREYFNTFITPTFCNNTEKILVCCKDGIPIFTPTQKNKKELTFKDSFSSDKNTNTRISEIKCKEYAQGVFQTVVFIASGARAISTPKCNYAGVELIVGGENANQGEFPHMAAIGWIDFNDNYAFQCGGSLISPRFVLTAGHCIISPKMKDPKPSIVRLGDQNLDPTIADGARPVDIPIKKVYKHPDYHSPEKYNDIALFELNLDVEFEAAIRPACLWTKPDFSGHTKAVATGWGVSDIVKKKQSFELQKVSLSLLENDHCEVLLEDTHNRNWDGFIESQMCAGELRGGKDTCQGDSGSPLQIVSKENNCIFYIVGITSFGWNCAEAGRPAVYTRVYSYLDWIESIVWSDE